ncbi:MAG: FtsQ-type POTRA domain-containing protein [Alphaproteobacteria bacterium]|nr:FtsQ-type POTRA domain-containing protein [Alphaproteobacteria bacterium]
MRRLIRKFVPKTTAKQTRKRRPPRGSRVVIGGLAAGGLAMLAGLGWAWSSGWAMVQRDALLAWGIERSVAAGLTIRAIDIQGLGETSRESALGALAIEAGDPILAFDPEAARTTLETLPWVRRAAVERRLPDRVRLRLVERRPLALWQSGGKLALIDETGVVILREELGRFRELPIVIGDTAPQQAQALFTTLKSEPALLANVATATLIGKRRWNLRLRSGVDVYLPEDGIASAWASLAEYDRIEGITKRKIAAVDLRLKGRLVIRLLSSKAGHASGRET